MLERDGARTIPKVEVDVIADYATPAIQSLPVETQSQIGVLLTKDLVALVLSIRLPEKMLTSIGVLWRNEVPISLSRCIGTNPIQA